MPPGGPNGTTANLSASPGAAQRSANAEETSPRPMVRISATSGWPASSAESSRRSVAMPPWSPVPGRPSSWSACRNSWATRNPRAALVDAANRDGQRSARASSACAATSSSPAASAANGPTSPGCSASAATAAMRVGWASAGSAAIGESSAVAPAVPTRPRVSVRRRRPPSPASDRRAVDTARSTMSPSVRDQPSSVRWASMPVNPPAVTRWTSAGRADACTARADNAQAACSAMCQRRSASSSTSSPATVRPGTALAAWTAAIDVNWSWSSAIAAARRAAVPAGSVVTALQ